LIQIENIKACYENKFKKYTNSSLELDINKKKDNYSAYNAIADFHKSKLDTSNNKTEIDKRSAKSNFLNDTTVIHNVQSKLYEKNNFADNSEMDTEDLAKSNKRKKIEEYLETFDSAYKIAKNPIRKKISNLNVKDFSYCVEKFTKENNNMKVFMYILI
jgi:hypothetical protein